MRKEPIPVTWSVDQYGHSLQQHPAIGCVEVGFSQGTAHYLAGESLGFHRWVSLSIYQADLVGVGGRQFTGSKKQVMSLMMSHAQWIRLISLAGSSHAVPCTIDRIRSGPTEAVPPIAPPETDPVSREAGRGTDEVMASLHLAITDLVALQRLHEEKRANTVEAKKALERVVRNVDHAINNEADIRRRATEIAAAVREELSAEIAAERREARGGPPPSNAALIARAPDMDAALRDCLALASSHRHEEWAQHVMRFCAKGGVVPSPLRKSNATT